MAVFEVVFISIVHKHQYIGYGYGKCLKAVNIDNFLWLLIKIGFDTDLKQSKDVFK